MARDNEDGIFHILPGVNERWSSSRHSICTQKLRRCASVMRITKSVALGAGGLEAPHRKFVN